DFHVLFFHICSVPFLPFFLFFLLIRPQPSSTLFPYTTLFRSVQNVAGVVGRVIFPALAEIGDDLARFRAAYLRTVSANAGNITRSEEHTSELQSRFDLVCRLLLEKKKKKNKIT